MVPFLLTFPEPEGPHDVLHTVPVATSVSSATGCANPGLKVVLAQRRCSLGIEPL